MMVCKCILRVPIPLRLLSQIPTNRNQYDIPFTELEYHRRREKKSEKKSFQCPPFLIIPPLVRLHNLVIEGWIRLHNMHLFLRRGSYPPA